MRSNYVKSVLFNIFLILLSKLVISKTNPIFFGCADFLFYFYLHPIIHIHLFCLENFIKIKIILKFIFYDL